MGKWATVCESTSACLFPIFAHLIIFTFYVNSYLCFVLAFVGGGATWSFSRVRWLGLSLDRTLVLVIDTLVLVVFERVFALTEWHDFSAFNVLEMTHYFSDGFRIESVSDRQVLGAPHGRLIGNVDY